MDTPFDSRFEAHFVNHMLRDTDFLNNVKTETSAELFSNEIAQRVVRLTLDFSAKENYAPGDLIYHVLDDIKKTGRGITEESFTLVKTYIDDLFKLELQNKSYLLKEFDKFIRHQKIKIQMPEFAKLIKQGDYERAEKIMKDLFTFKKSKVENLGREYTADVEERIVRREQEDGERFWTLIPPLDLWIRGLRRGELGVFQSQRSSIGKSAALVLLARNFVFQNKNVLIISLEMSEEDYEDRLDMCVCGVTEGSLKNASAMQPHLLRMFRREGRIRVKQFPGKTTTVQDLKDFKAQLENVHDFHPDVIIIDYGDELTSNAENLYAGGKEVYSALRGWAVEDQIVIWTASQSSKAAMDAGVADQQHMAESMGKVYIADVIVSINRTPAQDLSNETTLFIVKNRRGKARASITIKSDMERMLFYWSINERDKY